MSHGRSDIGNEISRLKEILKKEKREKSGSHPSNFVSKEFSGFRIEEDECGKERAPAA